MRGYFQGLLNPEQMLYIFRVIMSKEVWKIRDLISLFSRYIVLLAQSIIQLDVSYIIDKVQVY